MVFEDKFSSRPYLKLAGLEDDEFIEVLRDVAKRVIPAKEAARLVTPAVFDPDLVAETDRGLGNIAYLRGVWLDNDGGDLPKEEFARLLPRLRMVIYNTYRSRPGAERWRVFIPTQSAMPLRVHRNILNAIVKRLEIEGFWDDRQIAKNPKLKSALRHGFDMSKLNGASLFFLPSQAEDPTASFFLEFDGPLRGPLDPYQWARHCVDYGEPDPAPVSAAPHAQQSPASPNVSPGIQRLRAALEGTSKTISGSTREGRRADALQQWADVALQAGRGHDEFYRLGIRLAHAGLDDQAMIEELGGAAQMARNPRERRGEIAQIMRSVRKAVPR